MRKPQGYTEEFRPSGKGILPALLLSRVAMRPPPLLVSLLLIDIGLTFKIDVGISAQISTVAALIAAISSLIMGILSVKFAHKSLLLWGLVCFSISAVGCALAPTFPMILLMYAIYGFGLPIVGTMTFTLIAEHFPLKQRNSAIGWVNASPALAGLLGIPIIGILAEVGGWRMAFLGVVFPVCLLSLVVAAVGIHSPIRGNFHPLENTGNYIDGFKEVFTNRSATMCLVSTGLLIAGRQGILLFSVSLFRERFEVSTRLASIIYIGIGLGVLLGSVAGGLFANRFGKKPVTVLTALFMGVFAITYTNVSNVWLALILVYLGSLSFGMLFTTSSSLTLEQVPRFRGSMMSLNSAADNIGSSLGAGVGGLMLLMYDYGMVGLLLGTMSILSAIIYYFLVNDPTSSELYDSKT